MEAAHKVSPDWQHETPSPGHSLILTLGHGSLFRGYMTAYTLESRLRFTFTTRNGKRQFARMYDILISALDLSFTVYDIHANISSLMPESSVRIISFPNMRNCQTELAVYDRRKCI